MVYSEYQVGGSLQVGHPTYVMRQADLDLFLALERGEFCYAFNARQMGKSSLMVSTKHRFEQLGYRCAVVDMTCIGSEAITIEQWYKSLAYELWLGFDLIERFPLKQWWQTQSDLSPVYRLTQFIHEILQSLPDAPLLIFIDEIDSVLGLPFLVADFFGLIRYCYHQRSLNPDFNRLAFALFGVTTPSSLVQDKHKTPFNIGRAIDLQGFQFDEVQPLLQLFKGRVGQAENLMQEILHWTEGQPFLTQKLCQLVLQAIDASPQSSLAIPLGTEAFWVENLVQSYILQDWEFQDEPEHLRTIRDRLLRIPQNSGRLLGLYQQIWLAETQKQDWGAYPDLKSVGQILPPIRDQAATQTGPQAWIAVDDSSEQRELLLSGLVIRQRGVLRVKNRIYQQVFKDSWIQQQLGQLRPYAEAIEAWIMTAKADSSRLLRGQALQDAQQWAEGKKLSDIDYQFLAASQQLHQQEIQQELEAARLKEVEARLSVERRSVRRQRVWLTILGCNLVAAIGLGLISFWQYRLAAISEVKALAKASETFYVTHQNLDALVLALKANTRLKTIGTVDVSLTDQVAKALRQAVYNTSEVNRLTGQLSPVQAVAISPNGRLIASGTQDRLLQLWQSDGTLLKTLYAHSDRISAIAFSPDNQRIVSASGDRTIVLWRSDGTKLNRLIGHTGDVTSVIFSPTDSRVASASWDKTARLWRSDGTLLSQFVGHQDAVRDVAFSPDGLVLATASHDQTVKLWQQDGRLITTLQGHQGPVRTVAFSPNNHTLVSGGEDGSLKLWSDQGQLIRTLKGHRGAVQDVVFSPLGQLIASASSDHTIKLWNRDGILLATLQGHKKAVNSLVFSPDGRMLISGSGDETLRIWKVKNFFLTPLVGHEAGVTTVDFNPIDQTLVTGSDDRTVRLWNRRGSMLKVWRGHQGGVTKVAVDPKGRIIASASRDRTIRLWDRLGDHFHTSKTYSGAIRSVNFSPNGQQIIVGGEDSMLWIGDRMGNPLQSWVAHVGAVTDVACSMTSPLFASVSADGAIKFWKSHAFSSLMPISDRTWTKKGDLLTSFGDYGVEIAAVAFSPQSSQSPNASSTRQQSGAKPQEQLATAWGKTVKLWNIDGTVALTLHGHQGRVRDVAFSPDGQLIASASDDNTVKLWSRSGQELTTLDSHSAAVRAVAFSPDSRVVASVSDDQTGLLWDLQLVLDTTALQTYGCAWIQDYLYTSQTLEAADRQVCDQVSPARSN